MSSHIYTSSLAAPTLPRQSIFHYLFPETDSATSSSLPNGRQLVPPDQVTQIDPLGKRQLTRREVVRNAQRLAAGLRAPARAGRGGNGGGMGLEKGDVVGVIGMNSLEWLNAVYGSLCAGVRVSPINYAYTPPELLHQLSHSGVSLIFVDPALVPTLRKTLELGHTTGFSIPDERIVLLCPAGGKGEHGNLSSIEEVWQDELFEPERFENGDELETCVLCYSSGTTGVAKGVESTHHNFTSQLAAVAPIYPRLSRSHDTVLAYLPLSHMYSFTLLVLETLVSGVPLVVLPRFEERAVLRCVQEYAISWMLVVPPVLLTFANSSILGEYDVASLKGAMSAAAPLSEDLCKRVEKRMPEMVITQAYGLTETSPLSHVLPLDMARGNQSSIGQLVPTFSARLVDTETGADVPPNTPGELWLRGPSVMKGYYKNEAATRGTFSPDGEWFKTGDQARRDERGLYYIEDRLKELIKYKGFQVAPAELEAVLLTHPEVADCAVIGVYVEEQATELPRAYVVPRDSKLHSNEGLDGDKAREAYCSKIVEWIKGEVAQHKRLRGGVVVVESIPKSPSGKILRKNLRAALKEQQEKAKVSMGSGSGSHGEKRPSGIRHKL